MEPQIKTLVYINEKTVKLNNNLLNMWGTKREGKREKDEFRLLNDSERESQCFLSSEGNILFLSALKR